MLENLKFGFFAVLPILLMMVVGYFFRAIGFLKKDFFLTCDKLVFRVALPLLLFKQMMEADFGDVWNTDLLLFICIAAAIAFLLLLALGPLMVRQRTDRGAFCQGCVRSNYSIIGLPLAGNLFGNLGYQTAALIMPFLIPVYNILAILILTVNAPGEKRNLFGVFIKILKGIVTNPLIIAMVAGALFKHFSVSIPVSVMTVIDYCADLTMPLALMSLGATFEFSNLAGKLGMALSASLIKTVFLPSLVIGAGVLCGFRGIELGMIFVVFAGPTSVSSYSMAAGMGSNRELAGQIVVLSTLLSMFTLFLGAFFLRSVGLI